MLIRTHVYFLLLSLCLGACTGGKISDGKSLDHFRIVPLDNREEALTKGESVTTDSNYVGMGGSMREPYRLSTIRNVSSVR